MEKGILLKNRTEVLMWGPYLIGFSKKQQHNFYTIFFFFFFTFKYTSSVPNPNREMCGAAVNSRKAQACLRTALGFLSMPLFCTFTEPLSTTSIQRMALLYARQHCCAKNKLVTQLVNMQKVPIGLGNALRIWHEYTHTHTKVPLEWAQNGHQLTAHGVGQIQFARARQGPARLLSSHHCARWPQPPHTHTRTQTHVWDLKKAGGQCWA